MGNKKNVETIEPSCNHCKNQFICKVHEKAMDLQKYANAAMTTGNDKLYVMLTEGIAAGCSYWEAIKD